MKWYHAGLDLYVNLETTSYIQFVTDDLGEHAEIDIPGKKVFVIVAERIAELREIIKKGGA